VAETKAVTTCKLLVNGKWVDSSATEFGDIANPSTGDVIARVPMGGASDVDKAVQAAQQAFFGWAETPVVERARVMFRFKNNLEARYEEIARCVTKEHGKTIAESRASLQRGIEVVEFACGIPSLINGECLENLARNVDCETMRHPLGVVVGITPFNFPAMVPLWMYPIALTCGNTFVLKPSEKVPLSSMMIAEALLESGLPEGVFNIVHGGKDCVNALDQTVQALQASAFGCAGERCMAGSLALPVGKAAAEMMPRLIESAAKMTIGRTDEGGTPDMGPLISSEHLARVTTLIQKGEGEGAELALDGRKMKVQEAPKGFFLGPTIFDRAQPEMTIVKEEIFGPVLSVVRVETIDDAIEVGKNCQYGNGAVIYTNSGKAARHFKRHFNAGMIGINVGVPASMAWFPFTGWNNSFFGDLHIQGKEAIQFYTQQKMTMTRWFSPKSTEGKYVDPVWKAKS
jgi:malonate-semialdehyde dehydrogenase (acetylating)/methylmalonate-semialdehyde dehydrogenase